jgi:hypothetical protein
MAISPTSKIIRLQPLLRLLLIMAFICRIQAATAQNEQDTAQTSVPKLKISGSVGLSQDFFGYSSNDLLYRPYRPTSVTRFTGSASLSMGRFSLPFAMSLSTQSGGNSFTSPIPKKFSFRDLLNNYNQLSFNPKFGDFEALLGTQTPQYSELTTGDLPIFGAGGAWSPTKRKFRVAAFYGMSQRGVSSDTLTNNPGSYRRMSMTAKLGVGGEETSHIYVIGAKHRDVLGSAEVSPEGERPQENVVTSVDAKVVLFKKFYMQGELAISAFSRDQNIATLESDSFKLTIPRFLTKIYTPRLSSSFGAAGVGALGYDGKNWGFRAISRVYSPDYRTLNYPFLQNDRFEWLFEPSLNLFESKFSFSGSIGSRRDNLLRNKVATAYQTLGSANVNIQLTPQWSVSGTYANFGMRNTLSNDTFRLQNVSQNMSITSSYTFNISKTTHTISGTYTEDQFEDFNVVTGALSGNDSRIYLLTYSLGFQSFPLTLSAVGTQFENKISLGKVNVQMATLMAAYPFGKEKNINVSLQGNIMRTTLLDFTPDDNITSTLSIAYRLGKKINIGANGTLNIYNYGTTKLLSKPSSTVRLW